MTKQRCLCSEHLEPAMPEVTAPLDSSALLRFSSVFEQVCSGFLSLVERVRTSEVTQLNQTEPNWDSESGCCKGGDALELLLAWELVGGLFWPKKERGVRPQHCWGNQGLLMGLHLHREPSGGISASFFLRTSWGHSGKLNKTGTGAWLRCSSYTHGGIKH